LKKEIHFGFFLVKKWKCRLDKLFHYSALRAQEKFDDFFYLRILQLYLQSRDSISVHLIVFAQNI